MNSQPQFNFNHGLPLKPIVSSRFNLYNFIHQIIRVIINKIIMYHLSSIEENSSNHLLNKRNYQKLLNNVYETIKQKDFYLKNSQISIPLIEDSHKNFPKLLTKDFLIKQLRTIEKDRSHRIVQSPNSIQVKQKNNHKNQFKIIQQQQKLISRQNMQLLGLKIQKISYAQKQKKNSFSEVLLNINSSFEESQHNQNYQINQTERNERKQYSSPYKYSLQSERKKESQSIGVRNNFLRIRQKSGCRTMHQKKRKSMMRQSNPQYQNPIYDSRIVSYRELIFKVNYTYGVYIDTQKYDEEEGMIGLKLSQKYKAWVGLGNNGALVRQLLRRRFWWHLTEERQSNLNFLWTQLKQADFFQKQQPAPMWIQERQQKAKNEQKEQLDTELKTMNKNKKKDKPNVDHNFLSKIMNEKEKANYLNACKWFGSKQYFQKSQILKLRQITTQNQRMHNHLTNNFYLGNKKALFYNLKQYYELTGGNLFKSIPLTFHIKKGFKDPHYKSFVSYHKKRQIYIKKQQKLMDGGIEVKQPMRNIWIVKPGELTNRGHGITVIDQIYELDSIMKSQKCHQNGAQKTFIVQLYIDRPFLYRKRKFDIRHYMLITQIHGVFKAYWYKEGYIRTSSYEFDVNNFQREIHLTNDAVQKYTPLYGRYEPANKISYPEFQKYLDTTYSKQRYNFEKQILPKMKEICLDSVKSSFVKISPQRLKHNFEIFGLDFMIDSNFNPWLIQINTNPCLELACPLLSRIIPQMVDHTFRLTLDVMFPPPCHYSNTTKHLVPEASLQNLKFELIFDEKIDGESIKKLYRKSKNNLLEQIGQISDDEVYETNEPKVNLAIDQFLF